MNWAGIILLAFKAIAAAIDYLQSKRAIDAAAAEIYARYAKGALDEIKAANEARAAVRADTAAGGLRRDDGFRRND